MKLKIKTTLEEGFTIAEMLVSLLILVPLIGAVVGLFSVAVNQHSSEQSSIAANMDVRGALDMMAMELAQAGSHGDHSTATTAPITSSTSSQAVSVSSNTGFTAGDFMEVGTNALNEIVKVTAVGTGTISGIFRINHASDTPVRLFAMPYLTGVIPPAGLGANSSAIATRIQFYGDINGDGNVDYVEYAYDAANAQITRSMTPITQTTVNQALPLILNIKPNSVQFRLYTDSMSVVTSVDLALTVRNTWATSGRLQETQLSSRVVIPSAV